MNHFCLCVLIAALLTFPLTGHAQREAEIEAFDAKLVVEHELKDFHLFKKLYKRALCKDKVLDEAAFIQCFDNFEELFVSGYNRLVHKFNDTEKARKAFDLTWKEYWSDDFFKRGYRACEVPRWSPPHSFANCLVITTEAMRKMHASYFIAGAMRQAERQRAEEVATAEWWKREMEEFSARQQQQSRSPSPAQPQPQPQPQAQQQQQQHSAQPSSATGCVTLGRVAGDELLYKNSCSRPVNITIQKTCFGTTSNVSRNAALRVPQNAESKTSHSLLFGSFCSVLAGNMNRLDITNQAFGN